MFMFIHWTWKDVRGLTDDQLQIVYDKIRRAVDVATAKDHHQLLKRSGETLESSKSKKLKSSYSTTQPAELQETTYVSTGATIAAGDPIPVVTSFSAASSILDATPIVAGVSTTDGASGYASEAFVPIIELIDSPPKDTSLPLDPETEDQEATLRKSSRKKSIARRRTLPSAYKPKSDALSFDEDDPEAKFKRYLRQASDDDEPAEPVSLALVSDITTWEIIPTEFGLGEIHVLTRADGTVKRFNEPNDCIRWLLLPFATSGNNGWFDLLKVCRALTMPSWVLNFLDFKLEEIVMAMMTCLKSSGVHYQCITVKCGLL
nr:hypothetical protein [Tanacetum cinerariifolium]